MKGTRETLAQRKSAEKKNAPKTAETTDNGKKYDSDAKSRSGTILFTTIIVVGICQGCFFIYISLLPYLSRNYGIDPVTFGYIQTGASLIQFALSPFIGWYGDKFGARAVLILNAVCTALGHLILGLASGVFGIILSRTAAVGQDIRLGSHMMVSDLVSGEGRGAAVAKLAIPMSLGLLIGPALGGLIAKIVSPQQSLLITWMAPAACIIAMMIYIPAVTRTHTGSTDGAKNKDEKVSMISLMKQGPVALLMLIKILTDVPFMLLGMNLTMCLMTEFQLTPQMNGLVLSYNGALALAINIFITSWLAKRCTDDQLLRYAPWIISVGYMLLGQATTVWMILVALIPWNLGFAILESQTVARISHVAPTGKTGSLMGIQSSVLQFARIIAPLLGGYLLQNYGFRSIGWFCTLASLCLCVVVFPSPPREEGKQRKD